MANADEPTESRLPMARVRWEDDDSQLLDEAGLRRLVHSYRAADLEVPAELQNALRQFELYPTSQREHPASKG